MHRNALLILPLILLFLASCQSDIEPLPTAGIVATAMIDDLDRAIVTKTLAGEPTTVALATQTPISTRTQTPGSNQGQITASPASTEIPNESTATATVPPAAHVNVDQAPYAPSECSDKYPCNEDVEGWESRIRVPDGFEVSYFTRIDDQPTSITIGPDGFLYIASLSGSIFQIDETGDVKLHVDGFLVPTGIAFEPATERLYVSSRIDPQFVGGEGKLSYIDEGNIIDIITGIPCCYLGMHGPNGIAFGPDGFGYVGVGARADHGEIIGGSKDGQQDELHPWEATVLRFSSDGKSVEPYAFGLRNAYDLAWNADALLFATDNAPDYGPPDELHRVEPGRQHGYPWYECDVCFGIPDDVELVPTLFEFVPHAAAAGLTVYLSDHFPGYYNNLFVILWSAFEGAQKLMRFSPDGEEMSDFATGFAQPIDVAAGPEGNLYVADYATGIIFKISKAK
jgi:glucose/arabinose dehydrogenase